ncbi:MAG: leucine--tRNA ligase [Chthoniobacterales bacterium]|nr:leucine--tRNA ligase [Chthoniobacterales bacterium]
MSERRKPYPFDILEPKWQAIWEQRIAFHAPNPGEPGFDPARPKYYVLDMFPYPSGSGLHVGHPEGYTATDIVARYKRFRGFNVLHPIGWDAFGLPAEQYAIRTGQHPEVTTRQNIAHFKKQLKRIGFSYDWEREVSTADARFFRWTQWIFLQIYQSWFNPETKRAEPIATYTGDDPDSVRLAYVAEVPVNWCPELGTVLANEEVIDGKSEVGGFPVVRRPMRQWMLRITAYAERLIDELEPLDWPEGIKLLQRNWIGKSTGAEVRFAVAESDDVIAVFTTRPDTLYGATYMVLAPENPLVDRLTTNEQQAAVSAYRAQVSAKSDLERTDLAKDKSGVFTGAYAINPANGERIPIWTADYVLMGYGTGAIMAVPAHDERDLEFANRYGLEIREVVASGAVSPPGSARASRAVSGALAGKSSGGAADLAGEAPAPAREARALPRLEDGVAINSPLIDGLATPEAKKRITSLLEEKGLGRRTINYKLHDWLFSRQRYWGEPFPIVWQQGKHRAIHESELPLVPPPLDDFKPTGTGEPPLARAKDWVRYSDTATRELNTMPQWAGSCWYYLRFCDPGNEERFVGAAPERYWMGSGNDEAQNEISHSAQPGGVDLYVGGTEHAVLHLLYARFWHKVLFDLGHLSTGEPFQRLVNQGIILGEDGRKMSKRWGNVIDPLDVIAEYGADAFRCYEMFMGPLEQMKPWSMTGVEGVARFLARVWRLATEENQEGEWALSAAVQEVEPTRAHLKVIHATIKKVSEDIEALSFNTAIAQMMIFVNAFTSPPGSARASRAGAGASPATARPGSLPGGTFPARVPETAGEAPALPGVSRSVPVAALRTLLVLLNPFAPHLTSELWERLGERFPITPNEITGQPWPDYQPEFLVEDEVEIALQVNGKVRDRIMVPIGAGKAELEALARANPRVQEFIAGKTVRKVVAVEKKLVNVVAT